MRYFFHLVVLILCFMAFFVPDVSALEQKGQEEKVEDEEEGKPWRKEEDKEKKKKDQAETDLKKYKSMARDLLGQPHWSDRFLSLLDQETPKIAVHPLKEDVLPISAREAQIYLDGFIKALLWEAQGRYAVVGRKELGALVEEIDHIGSRSDSINPLGDLFDRAQSDLLAIPHISLASNSIVLGIKLVETETGRIVSTTQKSFKRKEAEGNSDVGGLSLQGAAKQAASRLLRDLADVRKIMVQGVRYQSSGAHSGFGQYFTALLSGELRNAAQAGPKNINDLDVAAFVVEEERFRGLKLNSASLEEEELSQAGRDYILKGTYWVFENYIDMRLKLEGANAKSIGWNGRLVRSEIPPELELEPSRLPLEEADVGSFGPIDLYLTSNKGTNPLYKVGEKMVLSMQTKRDAYLGCYYIQADGQIYRIFPHEGEPSGFIGAGFQKYIPKRGSGFSFEFTPPAGVEAVKCYATDRDVSNKIVKDTKKAAFVPIPLSNERELTKLYRSLDNVTLSEASLIVTLED